MDLIEAMRHMPGCRDYEDRDVDDAVLYRVFDNARFAPSGGNRQGWRVVVVRDPAVRRRLRELYQGPWGRYVAEHYGDLNSLTAVRRHWLDAGTQFANELDLVPVHLLVWVDVSVIAVTDINAGRPSVVAGGSIFPFIQNVQLAARAEGLGTRITTLLSYAEDEVRALVNAPDGLALAALVVMGWPLRLATKLNRRPVETFAVLDRFGGEPLTSGG